MATVYDVQGPNATGGNPGTATLPVEASVLNSTYGLIAGVKRYVSGGQDPTPTTPTGWTYLGGAIGGGTESTSFRTGVFFYRKRGNGATNSISVTGPATSATEETLVVLAAYPNIKTDDFTVPVDPALHMRSTTNLAQLSPGPVTTTEADSSIFAMAATGGTAGGTGFAWSAPLGRETGGSEFSRITWAQADIPMSGTDVDTTVSWTTAGVGVAGIIAVNTQLVAAAPTGTSAGRVLQIRDFTGYANASTVTATQTSGPAVSVMVNGLVANFEDIPGRTENVVVDFTISGGGGSVVETVTFAPGSGTVLVKRIGPLVMGADGRLY